MPKVARPPNPLITVWLTKHPKCFSLLRTSVLFSIFLGHNLILEFQWSLCDCTHSPLSWCVYGATAGCPLWSRLKLALQHKFADTHAQTKQNLSTATYIYGSVSAGREKWPFNVLFFFKKQSLCVTKPDEIASFSQFSVVSHMFCMPRTLWLDLWAHFKVP